MEPPPPADVNWLLSAIAQASAALTAIVGGLLISRYVSLHAEQQAARRRADDLSRREGEASTQLAAATRAYQLYFVDDFLDDTVVFNTIYRGKAEASVEDLLAEKDPDADVDPDLLSERFDAMQREYVTAVQTLLPVVPESTDQDDWADFKRGRDFNIGHRPLWEWVYNQVAEGREKAARKAEREARKSSQFGHLFPDIQPLRLPNTALLGVRGAIETQHEVAHLNSLRARVEAAQAERRALEQERRLAEETFEATRQPEGFNLALQVLSTLAVLGMGVPVAIMAFVPYSLPWLSRVGVAAVFFAGVTLLLRFLFVYAAYLHGNRAELPRNVLGLLQRRS